MALVALMAPGSHTNHHSPQGSIPFSRTVNSNSPSASPKRKQPLEVRIPTSTPSSHPSPSSPTLHSSNYPNSASYPPRGFNNLDRRRKSDSHRPSHSPIVCSPHPQQGFSSVRASANAYGSQEMDIQDGLDSSSTLLRSKFDSIDEKDGTAIRGLNGPLLPHAGSPRRRASGGGRAYGRVAAGRGKANPCSWFVHWLTVVASRRTRVLLLALAAACLTVLLSSGGDLGKVQQSVADSGSYSKVQDAWAWADAQRKTAAEAALRAKEKALALLGAGPRPLTAEEQAEADELMAAADRAAEVEEQLESVKDELEAVRAELEAEGKGGKPGKPKDSALDPSEADYELPPAAKLPLFDDDVNVDQDLSSGGKGQGTKPGVKPVAGSSSKAATTGRDGSTVRLADGTSFIYRNKL